MSVILSRADPIGNSARVVEFLHKPDEQVALELKMVLSNWHCRLFINRAWSEACYLVRRIAR